MRIKSIKIFNFRSIEKLKLDLFPLTVLCGPNSCGKSNVFRAIRFAFKNDVLSDEIYNNFLSSKRDLPGRPSIHIMITFEDCPAAVTTTAKRSPRSNVKYSFRAFKNGVVERKLEETVIKDINVLKEHFDVVYVPPIRDLTEGIEPFRRILGNTIKRARGHGSIKEPGEDLKKIVGAKAQAVLSGHVGLAKNILHAESLDIDTEELDLDSIYQSVSLVANISGKKIPLQELGTGHQSAVIMHIHKQLGESYSGDALFLFEEPDNHLHPTTIRSIGSDLKDISKKAQVLVTTHSPILLSHLGIHLTMPLCINQERLTEKRPINIANYDDRKIRVLLSKYGLRVTEPLLCRRIIVVEGPTDVAILKRLIEIRCKSTIDHLDVLLIQAGGKHGVAELSTLLHSLGADWCAVLDWDAAQSGHAPYTLTGIPKTKNSVLQDALKKIDAVLDKSEKRGRDVTKTLQAIETELVNGHSARLIYDGSLLEQLINQVGILTDEEKNQLKLALRSSQKAKYGKLLLKSRAWAWSSTIEEILLSGPKSEETAMRALIKMKRLSSKTMPIEQRRNRLINIIHDIGNEPDVLGNLVENLEIEKQFSHTEINRLLSKLITDIVSS